MKKSKRYPHLTMGQKAVIQKHMLQPSEWKVVEETDTTLVVAYRHHEKTTKVLDKSRNLWEEKGELQNAV